LPLRVLESREQVGYREAVRRLLEDVVERAPYPKRDAAVVLQADFTEDAADIVPLVKALEGGADIVAGIEGDADEASPRGLRFARWGARWVMGGAFTRAPVSDPLSGFRAYRIIVLKKAFREAGAQAGESLDRWSANVELLATLAPFARRIEEAPLSLRYDLQRRESRFRPIRALRDLRKARKVARWTGVEEGAAS
jgi:dolichol-phosphate mannosyltransferase